MRKVLVGFLMICFSMAFAQAGLKENLNKLVSEQTKQEVEIDSITMLHGDPNLAIVLLKDKLSLNLIPIVTNKDGNMLFVLTDVFFSQDKKDMQLVRETLYKVQEANNKTVNKEEITKLLTSIPDDYVIKIPSTTKGVKKITYIVSDPMCPHCQEELRHINDRLKDSNVYMVEVAFLGLQSKDKAAEILARIKNAKDAKQKVALLQEVYANTYVAKKPDKKELQKVENITRKIADSALIKGVPFIYEMDQ